MFPKRDEMPLLGRLSGMLQPKPGQENSSIAPEAKPAEGVAELHIARAKQDG